MSCFKVIGIIRIGFRLAPQILEEKICPALFVRTAGAWHKLTAISQHPVSIIRKIHIHRRSNLFHVTETLSCLRRFPRLVQCRQQHSRENRYDRYHDEIDLLLNKLVLYYP